MFLIGYNYSQNHLPLKEMVFLTRFIEERIKVEYYIYDHQKIFILQLK